VRAYHSITYTNSAHHSRMHSTHSMHSADAAAAAPAADQDSFSTSSTSAQARHELASGSFLAHVTPHGALPVLHTFSESPHAAPDAPPGRSDAAVTSRGNQQMSAAGRFFCSPVIAKLLLKTVHGMQLLWMGQQTHTTPPAQLTWDQQACRRAACNIARRPGSYWYVQTTKHDVQLLSCKCGL
jgi:hypothetical protein